MVWDAKRLCGVDDRDESLAVGFSLEFYAARDDGKDRVVEADVHASAGMELGAALTHDDVAGNNFLATEDFHAKPAAC